MFKQNTIIYLILLIVFITSFVLYPYYYPGKIFFVKKDQLELYSTTRDMAYYLDWKDTINTYYYDSSRPLISYDTFYFTKKNDDSNSKIYFGEQKTNKTRFQRDLELPNGQVIKKNAPVYVEFKNNIFTISDDENYFKKPYLFGRVDLVSTLKNYYFASNEISSTRPCKTQVCNNLVSKEYDKASISNNKLYFESRVETNQKYNDFRLSYNINIPKGFKVLDNKVEINVESEKREIDENLLVQTHINQTNQTFTLGTNAIFASYFKPSSYHAQKNEEVFILGKVATRETLLLQNPNTIVLKSIDNKSIITINPSNAVAAQVNFFEDTISFESEDPTVKLEFTFSQN